MRFLILVACVALAGCPDDGDGGGYAVPEDEHPPDAPADLAGPHDAADWDEPPASSGDPPTTSAR